MHVSGEVLHDPVAGTNLLSWMPRGAAGRSVLASSRSGLVEALFASLVKFYVVIANQFFSEICKMRIVRGSEIEFEPASHENPRDPGVLKRVLATQDHLVAGQVMMVNWSLLPVGKSFQAHYHEDMQEIFIILNGQVSMTVSGDVNELSQGDAILIDPREVHRMDNVCDEAVEYIVFGISTKAGGSTVVVE